MAGVAHLQHDHAGADAIEEFALQFGRDHTFRRGFQNKRGRIGGRKPRLQPVGAEIREEGT